MERLYDRGWRDYRRRRDVFIGTTACAILSVFVPKIVARVLGTELPHWLAAGLPLLWLIAFGAANVWFCYFRCPRCGNTFFMRMPVRDSLRNSCLHCGLRKFEVPA